MSSTATDRFWFSCAPEALKARNLQTNLHVVVTVEDTVEAISIEGVASRREAQQSIADAIGLKYEQESDKQQELVGFFMAQPMYEVAPTKAFGLIERAGVRTTRNPMGLVTHTAFNSQGPRRSGAQGQPYTSFGEDGPIDLSRDG